MKCRKVGERSVTQGRHHRAVGSPSVVAAFGGRLLPRTDLTVTLDGVDSRPPPSVTAVHNHMLDDEPRLFFMHFQRRSPAARRGAARGARSSEGGEGVIARRQLRL